MLKKTRTLAVMAAVILTMTACGSGGDSDDAADALAEEIVERAGGGDVEINTDDDEFTMEVENDEGGFAATLGGDLPADFPFPLPDEFEVRSSMQIDDEAGTSYNAVISVDAEEYDSVKAMYESWLEGEGFAVDAFEVENADGTKGVFISGERDDVDAFVSISVEEVANDDAGNLFYETAISLTWTPID